MKMIKLAACALSSLLACTHALAQVEEGITIAVDGGKLHGSLLLAEGKARSQVVLLIAGSGPTDRNGNTAAIPGSNDSLKQLALAMAREGISSLRYDKRGIAASAGAVAEESQLRFDTYVQDAAAWLSRLRSDHRFTQVFIAGHSEGSLIGMLAARKEKPDGFISIAGPARAADEIVLDQLKSKLPPAMFQDSERILRELKAGRLVADTPPALAALFRPSVQPYMVSWLRHTPHQALAQLAVPVLVVQGTSDLQVPASEARLLAAASPQASLKLIDGMNHVLKQVGDDSSLQRLSYTDPTVQLSPELVKSITGFVKVGAH